MEKKIQLKKVMEILLIVFVAGIVCILGYRVIVKADELPGKLCSVPVAAANLNETNHVTSRVQKVSYDTMRYGYMDDLMLAKMDYMDQYYESERMEEIRAVNNLTAMSQRTSDKLAYQKAKAEQEARDKQKRDAVLAAQRAKEAQIRAAAQKIATNEAGYTGTGSGDSGSDDTASRGGRVGEPVFASKNGESLGTFTVTAYCTCRICCGVYSGNNRTASGTVPTSNRTIAVDTNVIPFGTKVVINGQVYVAEDRGGAIKGNRIDMFFMTHKEALNWGRRTVEVYLAK